MSSLDLARWQFGIVTVYHYLVVPLTIGLSVLAPSCRPGGTAPATSAGSG